MGTDSSQRSTAQTPSCSPAEFQRYITQRDVDQPIDQPKAISQQSTSTGESEPHKRKKPNTIKSCHEDRIRVGLLNIPPLSVRWPAFYPVFRKDVTQKVRLLPGASCMVAAFRSLAIEVNDLFLDLPGILDAKLTGGHTLPLLEDHTEVLCVHEPCSISNHVERQIRFPQKFFCTAKLDSLDRLMR